MRKMRILGIDPGIEMTGYGIIEKRNGALTFIKAGIIKTSAKESLSTRLNEIYKEIIDLLQRHKPEVLILEELYSHYRHPLTAILMGHARGMTYLACSQKDIKLVSYSAKRIKKAITGNGNASKHQVRRMVQDILELKTELLYEDMSDALALAIAHVYISKAISYRSSIFRR